MLEYNELSKAQKIFKNEVDSFTKKYDMVSSMPYCFHDKDTVSIDGELHSIFNYMNEFNFGDSLREEIENKLFKIGMFLENINGCDFGFYKI